MLTRGLHLVLTVPALCGNTNKETKMTTAKYAIVTSKQGITGHHLFRFYLCWKNADSVGLYQLGDRSSTLYIFEGVDGAEGHHDQYSVYLDESDGGVKIIVRPHDAHLRDQIRQQMFVFLRLEGGWVCDEYWPEEAVIHDSIQCGSDGLDALAQIASSARRHYKPH